MYLPIKFPSSILFEVLEEFYKNSAVIWYFEEFWLKFVPKLQNQMSVEIGVTGHAKTRQKLSYDKTAQMCSGTT